MKSHISSLKSQPQQFSLSREAIKAYFQRLPDTIQVTWFRDSGYIVGKIKAGENEFVTQGKNAEDFIAMVNDAVMTVYDIPVEYDDLIKSIKTYSPHLRELAKLEDMGVTKAQLTFYKNKDVLKAV